MSTTKDNRIIQPDLFFNGNCEQAVEFYGKTLGAKVQRMVRFKDSPEPPQPGMVPPGYEDKIMDTSLRIGDTTVMAADGCATEKAGFQGFSLLLSAPTEAQGDRAFTALWEGGQVRMPLTKTSWSPRLGMVADHLGVGWMESVAPPIAPFIFSRTFDAPRDRVWQAWTQREQLFKWFGPKGFKMTTAKLDLRPGGSFHYSLQSADGKEMWGKFVYRVIDAPKRIVLVHSFSDEKGGLTRHPFSATWPLEMLSTTTLVEEGGKTKLIIQWSPLNPTEEERKTFDGAHDGMKQGWTGTFDQLAEYLPKR